MQSDRRVAEAVDLDPLSALDFCASASLDMPFPADHGAYVYYVFEGAAREDYRAGRLGQIEVQ